MFDLTTPQRQSKKVIALYAFKSLRGFIFFFVFAAFGMRGFLEGLAFTGLVLFVAATSLIGPVIQYLFFKFHIEQDEFILNKGWLFKEKKAVPLERIQSVNLEQNLLQRILKVYSVQIETAGSKEKELEIKALDESAALSLKQALLDISNQRVEQEKTEVTEPEKKTVNATTSQVSSTLLKLSFLDLFKVGMTQNHLRSGGVAIGLVVGSYFKFQDVIKQFFGDYLDGWEWENLMSFASLGMLFSFLLIFLVFSIVVSLITVFSNYYGFKAVVYQSHLELSMGLIKRQEIRVPIEKIQSLEFRTNPLRQWLGYSTAYIYQAQSDANKASKVSIPACKKEHIKILQETAFKDSVVDATIDIPCNGFSYMRLASYIMLATLIPTLVPLAYFGDYNWVVPMLIPAVLIVFWSYMYGSNSGIVTDKDFIGFKKGWLFKSFSISPVFKAQAVEKWDSIFIRRREEMHIKFHTASGSNGLRYFKKDAVNHLLNYINNTVIKSNRNWM
ncbi:hypothetical protein AAT17_00515 [Nonlabens sp. MIC269]|uniref:PH domain-containing protein n=1 Tax=Nonlabens sp. MIC269 TaxID=1476901 RepID=UPI000721FC85|nr:PH domain-containing protein [Nonlabens sp. MIC269]ALM19846.1 hypothetical protein AAT17_00515 [Nonlabens sp. MIC269]